VPIPWFSFSDTGRLFLNTGSVSYLFLISRQSFLFFEYMRSLIWRLLLSSMFLAVCMAFSKALDNSEQISVSLNGKISARFISTVNFISACSALAAKEDTMRLTVSLSQRRLGVI